MEGLQRVKQYFEQKGIDVNSRPELRQLFDDRQYFFDQVEKIASRSNCVPYTCLEGRLPGRAS